MKTDRHAARPILSWSQVVAERRAGCVPPMTRSGPGSEQQAQRRPHQRLTTERGDAELPKHGCRKPFGHFVDVRQGQRDANHHDDIDAGGDERRVPVAEAQR